MDWKNISMQDSELDQRSAARRALDEQVATEPLKPPLELPLNAASATLEAHLGRRRHPIAVTGIVENGVVRPLDPAVKLPEHSRVIIVASEPN